MPSFIAPMLATLVSRPFKDENWLFEIKWDGFRTLAFIDQKVELKSRNKNLLNQKFPSIVESLQQIDNQVILDGEIVALDSKGKPQFQLLQNYQKEGKGTLIYYVFDLLYKDGENLRELPLIERKEALRKYLKNLSLPNIRFTDHILNDGEGFFKEASKMHLEGIIGKKINSTYQSKRSSDWVKMKTYLRQEVVIGGFTAPKGSRKKLGALLIGVYNDEGDLECVGHVGGGFDTNELEVVYNQLKPLIQKKSPFKIEPKTNDLVTWVKPKLLCEVSFAEWTGSNHMRQPIYHGMRQDKDPKTVKKEIALDVPNDLSDVLDSDSKGKSKSIPKNSKEKSEPKKYGELIFTHVDKIYWPEEKYTKGDLLHYYETIAPFILPYLKDRPIVLHRFPDGIEGNHFYQKNIDSLHPKWIKTCPIQHEGKLDHYLLINDVRSLLYAVNLGSIDIHPFFTKYDKLDNPDFCVIDLDPHGVPFKNILETAWTMHSILEEMEVKHYCKTSGGQGLHICIPLHGKYLFEQSRQFAELICEFVYKKLPKFTSVERNPDKRQKKLYLDYLQNRKGQTIVAPYAVRPRSGAHVSTPITWEELNETLDLATFNMMSVLKRVQKIGDIFKPVLGPGINLQKALKNLEKFMK